MPSPSKTSRCLPSKPPIACFVLRSSLPTCTDNSRDATLGRRPEIHTANGHPLMQNRYVGLVKKYCHQENKMAEQRRLQVRCIADKAAYSADHDAPTKVRVSGDRRSRPPVTARSCHRGSGLASLVAVSPPAALVVAGSSRGVRSRGGGGVVNATARDGGGDNLCLACQRGLSQDSAVGGRTIDHGKAGGTIWGLVRVPWLLIEVVGRSGVRVWWLAGVEGRFWLRCQQRVYWQRAVDWWPGLVKGRVRRRLSGIGMPVGEGCWTRIHAAVTRRMAWTAGNVGS